MSSKCLAIGTKVLMFDGSIRPVESIAVGDQVMGPDSNPRRVLHTTTGIDQMYRVDQTHGESYTVNSDHILSTKKRESVKNDRGELSPAGNYRRPLGRYHQYPDVYNVNVVEFASSTDRIKQCFRGYRVGQEYPERDVTIPPYLLGMWLGDGDKQRLSITTMDQEVVDYVYSVADAAGLSVSTRNNGSRATSYRIHNKAKKQLPLWQAFRGYGICSEDYCSKTKTRGLTKSIKRIPHDYIANSRGVRLQVLAGLLDSDGCLSKGRVFISAKCPDLGDDIARLARSLGFCVSASRVKTSWMHKGRSVAEKPRQSQYPGLCGRYLR